MRLFRVRIRLELLCQKLLIEWKDVRVGMSLWAETIIHVRCKLLFKARGVRRGHRLSGLHRPAGKGRWPCVVDTLDLRTDSPRSRPSHSARSRPTPPPSYTTKMLKRNQHLARTTSATKPRRSWGRSHSKSRESPA